MYGFGGFIKERSRVQFYRVKTKENIDIKFLTLMHLELLKLYALTIIFLESNDEKSHDTKYLGYEIIVFSVCREGRVA
jgi:hypothetical protein